MDTQNYYHCITDCWRYFQRFSNPVNDDRFWKSLVNEGNELSRRHGNTDFAVRLVNTIQMEIERILKGDIKDENRAKK